MKHDHTPDNTLQAAVDNAFKQATITDYITDENHAWWKPHAPYRLALARALLDALPEPINPELDAFRSFFGKASAILHELDGRGDNGSTEDFLERLNALLEYKCTDEEKDAVEALMKSQELTAKQVLLQALRHYQMTIQGKPDPTPPVVDGKTPGQVAFEAWTNSPPSCGSHQWLDVCVKTSWEAAASAVLAAFGNQSLAAAIARMEAVPLDELEQVYWVSGAGTDNVAAVRARLIAAAKEGQAEAVDWKALFKESEGKRAELWAERNGLEGLLKAAIARAEKAEAELAIIHDILDNDESKIIRNAKEGYPEGREDRVLTLAQRVRALCIYAADWKSWHEALVASSKAVISQLRPLSEAGPVPEGCVRVFASMEEKWYFGSEPFMQDSHFADIRLPADEPTPEPQDPYAELKKAHAEGKVIEAFDGLYWVETSTPAWIGSPQNYRIKPAPETFEAHGKTWTPALGDLVQLKSGGPVMVIERILSGTVDVAWINNHGDVKTANLCITSLTPAKEEQP